MSDTDPYEDWDFTVGRGRGCNLCEQKEIELSRLQGENERLAELNERLISQTLEHQVAIAVLREQVRQIEQEWPHQHKPECELSRRTGETWPSPTFGRRYIKRVNGTIGHLWEHVCGLQGWNPMIDPACPGCEQSSDDHQPTCTCGLSDALALLVSEQTEKPTP